MKYLRAHIAIAGLAASMALAPPALAQAHFQVEQSGSGAAPAVMFIPGLASPGEVWDETVSAFGNTIDARIITAAGFGDVPAAGEGAFMAPLVDALVTYLDEEALGGLTLVGHSMGGQIALQIAAARPEAVEQVIIVDSAPFYARLFNPAISAEQAAAFGQGMQAQMASLPREQFLTVSRQGLMIQSISAAGQDRVMGYMEQADQGAVARAMGEVAGTDFSPVLGDVQAEIDVLVAWAEGAPVSASQLQAIYEDQYAGARDAEVHMIHDSRHFIMFDQPDAFQAILRAEILED